MPCIYLCKLFYSNPISQCGCFGLELMSQQIPAMEEFSSIKADALSIQQYVVGTM